MAAPKPPSLFGPYLFAGLTCSEPHCRRRGPYESLRAIAIHKSVAHGIASPEWTQRRAPRPQPAIATFWDRHVELEPVRRPQIATDGFWCTEAQCPRPGPYASSRAIGSHRRMRHGLQALTWRRNRPLGGTIHCTYPGCAAEPYVTRGGLGYHVRMAHAQPATNDQAVRKRLRRAEIRAEKAAAKAALEPKIVIAVPAHPLVAAETRRNRQAVSRQNEQRLRLAVRTEVELCTAYLNAKPLALALDAVTILETNFARRKHKDAIALRPDQHEWLRQRLWRLVSGSWSTQHRITPPAVRDAAARIFRAWSA